MQEFLILMFAKAAADGMLPEGLRLVEAISTFAHKAHLPGNIDEHDEYVKQQLAWATFRQGDMALDSNTYVNVVNQVYTADVINASIEPRYDGDPVTLESRGHYVERDVVRQSFVIVIGCNPSQGLFIRKGGFGIAYTQMMKPVEPYELEHRLKFMNPIIQKGLASALMSHHSMMSAESNSSNSTRPTSTPPLPAIPPVQASLQGVFPQPAATAPAPTNKMVLPPTPPLIGGVASSHQPQIPLPHGIQVGAGGMHYCMDHGALGGMDPQCTKCTVAAQMNSNQWL